MKEGKKTADLRELERSDAATSREHLAAGRPIVYCDEDTPPAHVIQCYPAGRRELIRVALTPAGIREAVVCGVSAVEPFPPAPLSPIADRLGLERLAQSFPN